MVRKLVVIASTVLFVMGAASLALCADTVGTVSDAQGHAVSGVQVIVRNSAGKLLGKVKTDSRGQYQIKGLAPGTYTYTIDPLASGFKGGDAVAQLGLKGLTIDWRLSATAPAIALASEGTDVALAGDPLGFSPLAFAALVAGGTAVVAGGAVGGYAAAGGFNAPSSPSR